MDQVSSALEIVHTAAEAALLEQKFAGRTPGIARDGVDLFGDFVMNHHEDVDEAYGPVVAATVDGLSWSRTRLGEAPIEHPLNDAVLIVLDLAVQQQEETARHGASDPALDLAIRATAFYWENEGPDVCEKTAVIALGDDSPGPN